MNRHRLVILIMTGVVVSVIVSRYITHPSRASQSCKTHHDSYRVESLDVHDKTYTLLVADSPSRWRYGLMNIRNKREICGHDGMVFYFPIAVPQTFWNKNTLVDLQVYWMNKGTIIGETMLPSVTDSGVQTITSPDAADTVVEIIR